jgi:hypothetical protein
MTDQDKCQTRDASRSVASMCELLGKANLENTDISMLCPGNSQQSWKAQQGLCCGIGAQISTECGGHLAAASVISGCLPLLAHGILVLDISALLTA